MCVPNGTVPFHELCCAFIAFTHTIQIISSSTQVPNIRFNVAKELESVAPVCGMATYESQIGPVLSMLMEDTDRDVRFYAEKASKALDEVFNNQ